MPSLLSLLPTPIFFSSFIYLFIFWLHGMSDLSSLHRDEMSAPVVGVES